MSFYGEQLSTNADIKHAAIEIYRAICSHKLQPRSFDPLHAWRRIMSACMPAIGLVSNW